MEVVSRTLLSLCLLRGYPESRVVSGNS
jgi:hypothetical protein